MTAQETDGLPADELTEVRRAAKTLWDSGLLEPHEKTHVWQIILRIDGRIKELGQQDSTVG
jgi:hypothetical protein